MADICGLALLTAGAMLLMGYHPCAEDAEIYLPGIEKLLHPELFPKFDEFFLSHARLTLFPNLIAWSLRLTHLPLAWALFLWQAVSVFLLLLACYELSTLLFTSTQARWSGVCLVAVLLTIPVAGTALYIMDQYLNPRNLAAFAAVFSVARILEKKYVRALIWIVLAALVHPLMWFFPFSLGVLLIAMERREGGWTGKNLLAPAALTLIPIAPAPSRVYEEVARMHPYFYIQNWTWYEWAGIAAPWFLFWWFARLARARRWDAGERLCRALLIYGFAYGIAALVFDLPHRFETLARLQPLRSLHLEYIILFLFIGGFAGEYILQRHAWRWFLLLLLLPLCAGMFFAQRSLFAASEHIEWPGSTPRNAWSQAFLWIRGNTPNDAVFALDPKYMGIDGEDEIGFRCLAERSRMADWVKDNGVVSMFPGLADEWWNQVQALANWRDFRLENFQALRNKYGVSWVVVQQPGIAGLECEFQNAAVKVCRVP